MFPGPWPRLLIALLLTACAGCSEDGTGPQPDPPITPAYMLTRGVEPGDPLVGAAWFAAPPAGAVPSAAEPLAAQYHLPERPFKSMVEERWYGFEGEVLARWIASGPEGAAGEALEGIVAREAELRSALTAGWGEFSMSRGVAGGPRPVLLDPYCPIGAAVLGWIWRAASGPDSLEIELLWLPDVERPPLPRAALLIHEGESGEEEVDLEGFRLEFDEGPYYFKLMADPFPVPYRAWWEGGPVFLQFIGEEPPDNLEDLRFDPDFPAPESHAVEAIAIDAGGQILAGEILRPDATGPFPAVLLVPEAGPRDRDGSALLGFLAPALADAGCLVLRFDMPGTGGSSGLLSELDLDGRRAALSAAWQLLRADADADPARCFIAGHGEGGALALHFAADNAEAAGAAALATPRYDPEDLPWIPEAAEAAGPFAVLLGEERFVGKYQDLLDFDSGEFLPRVPCRVFLAMGENDERVPVADMDEQEDLLVQAASVKAILFADLNHEMAQGRPDAPPPAAVADSLAAWIGLNPRRAP